MLNIKVFSRRSSRRGTLSSQHQLHHQLRQKNLKGENGIETGKKSRRQTD
jgi:hypothetical protein